MPKHAFLGSKNIIAKRIELDSVQLAGLQSLFAIRATEMAVGDSVLSTMPGEQKQTFFDIAKKFCGDQLISDLVVIHESTEVLPKFQPLLAVKRESLACSIQVSKQEEQLLTAMCKASVIDELEKCDYIRMSDEDRKMHQLHYYACASVLMQLAEKTHREVFEKIPGYFWSIMNTAHMQTCFDAINEKDENDHWLGEWISEVSFRCLLCKHESRPDPGCDYHGQEISSVCENCLGAIDIRSLKAKGS